MKPDQEQISAMTIFGGGEGRGICPRRKGKSLLAESNSVFIDL